MTDDAYKAKTLQGLDPLEPAIGGLMAGRPVRWSPVAAVMRAQDTIPATSRRIVAKWSLSGAQDWAQPSGSANPGDSADPVASQVYPDDDWRVIATATANITPGCELVAYAVASPSGLVQKQVTPVGGDSWASDSAWAEVRVGVTWTNGASTTGPHYKSASIPGSPSGTYTGAESAVAGGNHTNSMLVPISRLRPPGYTSTPATAAAYSEWTVATITIQVRGGWRGQSVVVHEQPLSHVTAHDNDGLTSVHAMPAGFGALTPGPMTRAPDGATNEEHRFGTRRAMQVAERQSERLGPRIMQWTCWDESDTTIWDQSEGNPVSTTSATFVHLLDSSITTYTNDTPGWVVGASYAQLARLCDPTCIARGAFAAVPVRVRVDAFTGKSTGVVRVQCGAYDWVDVTVADTRAVYTATGYIEGQINADDDAPPLVVWMRTSAEISVYSVSVDFGTW